MNRILLAVAQVIILAAFIKVPETYASSWTNLGSGMNRSVWGLAIDTNGQLFASGAFTTAGGVSANNIAKWDGTNWTNFGNGLGSATNHAVQALVIGNNGELYASWSTTIILPLDDN